MYIELWLLPARHVSTLLHLPLYTWAFSLHLEKEGPGPSYEKVAAREDGLTHKLSLSPSRTLVTPYCKRIRPGRRTTRGRDSLYCFPLVSRFAPTHLGWDTQRQFTRRSRDPPGSKRRQISSQKI
jgi:hypothetical protein